MYKMLEIYINSLTDARTDTKRLRPTDTIKCTKQTAKATHITLKRQIYMIYTVGTNSRRLPLSRTDRNRWTLERQKGIKLTWKEVRVSPLTLRS
jgi:hypothetical protein